MPLLILYAKCRETTCVLGLIKKKVREEGEKFHFSDSDAVTNVGDETDVPRGAIHNQLPVGNAKDLTFHSRLMLISSSGSSLPTVQIFSHKKYVQRIIHSIIAPVIDTIHHSFGTKLASFSPLYTLIMHHSFICIIEQAINI